MDFDAPSLVASFYEISSLRRTARSHRQTLGTSDLSDNIAAHAHLASYIGMVLGSIVEGADPFRVVMMDVNHDNDETRTGDQNWVHKKYVSTDAVSVREGQLLPLMPYLPWLRELMEEYEERKTPSAKAAKDADILAQVVLLMEYAMAGNEEAKRWLSNRDSKRSRFLTAEGVILFDAICDQRPSTWWDNIHTGARTHHRATE